MRRVGEFKKDVGRFSLRFYPEGYPYSIVVGVGHTELQVHGTEELLDLQYMLGRLLSHIEQEEGRT